MPGNPLSGALQACPDALLRWQGNKPLAVMLHNSYPVITRSDVFESWNASTRQIKHFIEHVQQNLDVIDLETYGTALQSGRGRGQVLFTFDDGYSQMLRELGDLLHAKHIRPVVFLISGLQTGELIPWYYQLALFFRRTALAQIDYRGTSCSISIPSEKARLYRQIQNDLLTAPSVDEFQNLLRNVMATDASIDYNRLDADMEPFSDSDVQEVLSRGWAVGCHGHSHIPFSLMSDEELAFEIETARSRLLERYGVRPTVISYPNGAIRSEQLPIIGRWFQLGFMAGPQPEEAGALQCGRLDFPRDRDAVLDARWSSPAWRTGLFHHALRPAAILFHARSPIR